MSQKGTGTTITFSFSAPFASTSFSGRYQQIGGLGESLEVLDDTHLGSTVTKEYEVADLMDLEPIECTVFTDTDVSIPIGKKALITITYPPKSGQTNGARLSATGFIASRTGPDVQVNQHLMSNFSIQFDGKTTKPTITVGS